MGQFSSFCPRTSSIMRKSPVTATRARPALAACGGLCQAAPCLEMPGLAALGVLRPAHSRANENVLRTLCRGAFLRQLLKPGLQNCLSQTWEARGLGARRGSCGLECDGVESSVFSVWRMQAAGGSSSVGCLLPRALVSLHGCPLLPLGRRKCSGQFSHGQLHQAPWPGPELGGHGGGGGEARGRCFCLCELRHAAASEHVLSISWDAWVSPHYNI